MRIEIKGMTKVTEKLNRVVLLTLYHEELTGFMDPVLFQDYKKQVLDEVINYPHKPEKGEWERLEKMITEIAGIIDDLDFFEEMLRFYSYEITIAMVGPKNYTPDLQMEFNEMVEDIMTG